MSPFRRLARPLPAALALAAAIVLFWAPGRAAVTGPVPVTAARIASFDTLGIAKSFGPFEWRGGLTLSSSAGNFGGLSGLVVDRNCERLVSVSDRGEWFMARLAYADGNLAGLADARMEPLRGSNGKPFKDKVWADSEAIAPLGQGRLGIAFERKVRFGVYDFGKDGPKARFETIPSPRDIELGPYNGEVEAFGLLPSGAYVAIAERQRDDAGNIRAWTWQAKSATAFSIARYDSYNVTDLAVLPDGQVLTIERRFNRSSIPGMIIRRFDPKRIKPGETVKPDLLLEAGVPFYAIDNMEGIAVCERGGEIRVTLQSDDNFNRGIQSTILLQFAYKPD